ncbi:MAG: hypothetical protein GY810_08925 [Aureispira sp.]|nr:hypothetical protein [Aureispira sp.]
MSLNKNTTIELSVESKKTSSKNLVQISNWVNVALNAKEEEEATKEESSEPDDNSKKTRLLQMNMSFCRVMLSKKR